MNTLTQLASVLGTVSQEISLSWQKKVDGSTSCGVGTASLPLGWEAGSTFHWRDGGGEERKAVGLNKRTEGASWKTHSVLRASQGQLWEKKKKSVAVAGASYRRQQSWRTMLWNAANTQSPLCRDRIHQHWAVLISTSKKWDHWLVSLISCLFHY